jgi:hypothetical protein
MKAAAKTRTSKPARRMPSARAVAVKGHAPAFREIVGIDRTLVKAAEDYRTPRRFAFARAAVIRSSALECASQLALFHCQSMRILAMPKTK